MKKFVMILVFLNIIAITTTLIVAFLVDKDTKDDILPIGHVEVDYDIYFENTRGERSNAMYVPITENLSKEGIYYIDLTDVDSDYFISKLKMDFIINSSVDTYFRVYLFIQKVLTIEEIRDGISYKTEIQIVKYDLKILYDELNWYFDSNTNYYYHKNKVKKIGLNSLKVPFIGSEFGDANYGEEASGYSLQLGIKIEATQALLGPENNWGLTKMPWE